MASIAKYVRTKHESTRSSGLKRSYGLEWKIKFTDASATEADVFAASFAPKIYEPYALDTGAICKNKTATKVPGGKGRIWTLAVDYDNESISKSDSEREKQPNPILRAPEVSWGYASFSKILEKDVDGVLVATPNGEPFDPPVEADDFRPVLKIKRNEATFSVQTMLQYGNAVNSDTFFGAEAKQAKMLPPTAVPKIEENVEFWEVSYEIHFDRGTWTCEILNQGFREKQGSNIGPAMENPMFGSDAGNNICVQRPVLLAADGTRLPSGDDPVYLSFKRYREVPFAPLGLEG